jgi:hypothetical protein
MEIHTGTLVIITVVFAIGLFGVVVIETISMSQEAQAHGCRNGLPNNLFGINASQLRCLNPPPK